MLQSQVNLRYYQDDAVNVFTVGGCKNGIIVCPTGAGKSIVISELAKRLNNTNVLVLQPSKEILEQNFTKYSAYSNDASIYSASLNKRELNRVTFATIGSVIKLPNSILREFKVIVVDECHLVGQYGQYAELINIIKPDILIGLTATPYRNNSKFQVYSFSGNKSELFNISEKDIINCGQNSNILESKSSKINDINPTINTDSIYTKEHIVNVIDFLKDIKENIEHNIEYFENNNFSVHEIKWIYRSAMLDGRRVLFEKYNKINK